MISFWCIFVFKNIIAMKTTVVGMGELLWDVLTEGKRIGGAPANFAYHVSQFGFDSHVVSAVGNDADGDEIVEVLRGKLEGIEVARVPFPTGTVQVSLDAAGVPQYEIKEGVAWDNIPFTARLRQLAAETRAVCFGSLAQRSEVSRNTIRQFLQTMPDDDGWLKIFDINLRQTFYCKEVIEESMRLCNVMKINDEELKVVADMFGCNGSDCREVCRKLLDDFSLQVLILTCGADGSKVFARDCVSELGTPRVTVADTVGAGDSFTAAFTASYLRGMTVAEAHNRAVQVSAYVCTQNGAMQQLPQELIGI